MTAQELVSLFETTISQAILLWGLVMVQATFCSAVEALVEWVDCNIVAAAQKRQNVLNTVTNNLHLLCITFKDKEERWSSDCDWTELLEQELCNSFSQYYSNLVASNGSLSWYLSERLAAQSHWLIVTHSFSIYWQNACISAVHNNFVYIQENFSAANMQIASLQRKTKAFCSKFVPYYIQVCVPITALVLACLLAADTETLGSACILPCGVLQKAIVVCGLIYPASQTPFPPKGNLFEDEEGDNCRLAVSHNA